jgi:hypothetical protein
MEKFLLRKPMDKESKEKKESLTPKNITLPPPLPNSGLSAISKLADDDGNFFSYRFPTQF